MEVVVSVPLCPLYASATAGAERVDELLCGWPAQLLEEHSTGWCRVRTAYRYEGWARREHFSAAPGWALVRYDPLYDVPQLGWVSTAYLISAE